MNIYLERKMEKKWHEHTCICIHWQHDFLLSKNTGSYKWKMYANKGVTSQEFEQLLQTGKFRLTLVHLGDCLKAFLLHIFVFMFFGYHPAGFFQVCLRPGQSKRSTLNRSKYADCFCNLLERMLADQKHIWREKTTIVFAKEFIREVEGIGCLCLSTKLCDLKYQSCVKAWAKICWVLY